MVGNLKSLQFTKMQKEKSNIQDSISAAIVLVEAGVVHHFIVQCLMNDGYSKDRAETILRWAINNCKGSK